MSEIIFMMNGKTTSTTNLKDVKSQEDVKVLFLQNLQATNNVTEVLDQLNDIEKEMKAREEENKKNAQLQRIFVERYEAYGNFIKENSAQLTEELQVKKTILENAMVFAWNNLRIAKIDKIFLRANPAFKNNGVILTQMSKDLLKKIKAASNE